MFWISCSSFLRLPIATTGFHDNVFPRRPLPLELELKRKVSIARFHLQIKKLLFLIVGQTKHFSQIRQMANVAKQLLLAEAAGEIHGSYGRAGAGGCLCLLLFRPSNLHSPFPRALEEKKGVLCCYLL